jgi:hypothetical protein
LLNIKQFYLKTIYLNQLISKGQVLDFLSFWIVIITLEGEIRRKEALGEKVGHGPVNGRRL